MSHVTAGKRTRTDDLQPVPKKMRLEMLVETQIEILNGGEILVIFKFILNQHINSNLHHMIPRNLGFSILISWLKSPHHSGFRFAFRWPSRVSSSWEWDIFFFGYATTQLALILYQERTQVVCRWCAVMGWSGSARLEGTPAMDFKLDGICTHM